MKKPPSAGKLAGGLLMSSIRGGFLVRNNTEKSARKWKEAMTRGNGLPVQKRIKFVPESKITGK